MDYVKLVYVEIFILSRPRSAIRLVVGMMMAPEPELFRKMKLRIRAAIENIC